MEISIVDILTLATANVVLGGILVSLVGATIAIAVRHKTSQNWNVNIEDIWYYVLSGGVSVALVLLGFDTGTILGATTGINTPLAVIRTAIERRNGNGPTVESVKRDIAILEKKRVDVT